MYHRMIFQENAKTCMYTLKKMMLRILIHICFISQTHFLEDSGLYLEIPSVLTVTAPSFVLAFCKSITLGYEKKIVNISYFSLISVQTIMLL